MPLTTGSFTKDIYTFNNITNDGYIVKNISSNNKALHELEYVYVRLCSRIRNHVTIKVIHQ